MSDLWLKNGEGEVVPQKKTVNLKETYYDEEIIHYQELLTLEENKKEPNQDSLKALKEVVDKLTSLKESDKQEISFVYTPMFDYELTNIAVQRSDGALTGCEGVPVLDRWADICAHHCIDPKHDYDAWVRMKDPTNKKVIALHILQDSTPQREVRQEVKKKVRGILLKSLSAETTSSINTVTG